MYEDVATLASEKWAGRAPGTAGNEAAVQMVADVFAESGLLPAGEDDSFRQKLQFLDRRADNVLGVAPGTDPKLADQVIVIGAHLDHLGHYGGGSQPLLGADDNASGAAVLLELVRRFACEGIRPARTILFVAWNLEELGSTGSCYYVDAPSYPLQDTMAVFSLDMLGGGNGTGLEVKGAQLPSLAWIAELMARSAEEMGMDYTVEAGPESLDSDHGCFVLAGVDGVQVSTLGNHAYWHDESDTLKNVDPQDLLAGVSLMWATLVPLAMGTEAQYLCREPVRSERATMRRGFRLH